MSESPPGVPRSEGHLSIRPEDEKSISGGLIDATPGAEERADYFPLTSNLWCRLLNRIRQSFRVGTALTLLPERPAGENMLLLDDMRRQPRIFQTHANCAERTVPGDRRDLDIGTLSGVYSQRGIWHRDSPLTGHRRLIMLTYIRIKKSATNLKRCFFFRTYLVKVIYCI